MRSYICFPVNINFVWALKLTNCIFSCVKYIEHLSSIHPPENIEAVRAVTPNFLQIQLNFHACLDFFLPLLQNCIVLLKVFREMQYAKVELTFYVLLAIYVRTSFCIHIYCPLDYFPRAKIQWVIFWLLIFTVEILKVVLWRSLIQFFKAFRNNVYLLLHVGTQKSLHFS